MGDPYFDYERDYPLGDPRRRLLGARYEDDEDEAQAQGAAATGGAPAAAPAFPARPSLASLLPQPDPEMDERWRGAERQALDLAGQGGSYGVAEGIRDFAPMAVGGLLDILVNKGRGLGALAAGGMQAIASQQGRRDERQKEAAKQALLMRQQRESGADRAIQAQHAMLRGAELEQRWAELQAKNPNLTPEQIKRKFEAEVGLTEAQKNKAQADADWAGFNEMMQWAMSGTKEDREKLLLKLKEREQDLAERKAKADDERNRLDRERRDQEYAEKAEAKRKETSQKNIDRFNRDTKGLQTEAHYVRELGSLIRKYGKGDYPGQGPLDSRWPDMFTGDDGLRIKGLIKGLLTSEILEATGKASRAQEEARITAIHGLGPNATGREFALGIKAFEELLRDRLRGYAAGKEDDAREALDAAGLSDFVYGPGSAPATGAPAGQASPPSAAPPAGPPQPNPPPSAAAPDQPAPEHAADPKLKRQRAELMQRIPEGERDAVLAGIAPLPIEEQISVLREWLAKRVAGGYVGDTFSPTAPPKPLPPPAPGSEPAPSTGPKAPAKSGGRKGRASFESRRRKAAP